MPDFRDDNRGQSLGISNFILALVAGAIVFYFVVVRVGSELLSKYGAPESQTTGWILSAGEAMPVVFAIVALFGILLRAVRQRGRA